MAQLDPASVPEAVTAAAERAVSSAKQALAKAEADVMAAKSEAAAQLASQLVRRVKGFEHVRTCEKWAP